MGHCFYSIFFIYAIIACSVNKPTSSSGIILLKKRFFNVETKTLEKDPSIEDLKIWYKDSLVIQETRKLIVNKDINGRTTMRAVIGHYTFIDLKTKSFYEYGSFTDTASLLNKYSQPDSVGITGGWNFYNAKKMIYRENLNSLSDTMINGLTYMRITSYIYPEKDRTDLKYTQTGYLRCDKKNALFHYDMGIDEKFGCLLVRVDLQFEPYNKWMSSEIEFLTDTLSSQEVKIF